MRKMEEFRAFQYIAWVCIIVFAVGTILLALKLNAAAETLVLNSSALGVQ